MQTIRRSKVRDQVAEQIKQYMGRLTRHLGFHAGLLDADPQQLIDSRVIG